MSSRYRGVCWHKQNQHWKAMIRVRGKNIKKFLGYYNLEEDAARAYDRAAVVLRGSDATINFSLEDYGEELQMHDTIEGMSKEELEDALVRAARQLPADAPIPRRTGLRQGQPAAQPAAVAEQPPAMPEPAALFAADEPQEEGWEGSDAAGNEGEPPPTLEELCAPGAPWNEPLPPLDIPEGGLDPPLDEEERQREFDAAMEDPRFRLYMERRVATGSVEPNLHILGTPPFDPWPYVLPDEPEEPPPPPQRRRKPRRYDMYRAVAHLAPGGFEGLLTDTESSESEGEGGARGRAAARPHPPIDSPFAKRWKELDDEQAKIWQPFMAAIRRQELPGDDPPEEAAEFQEGSEMLGAGEPLQEGTGPLLGSLPTPEEQALEEAGGQQLSLPEAAQQAYECQ